VTEAALDVMETYIYRGDGVPHDGLADLPDPPPWREFLGEVLSDEEAEQMPVADPRPGADVRAAAYRPEPAVVQAVNAAILLRRPLLVTGRPGVGKSTLAQSIAWELQLGPVLYWPITSRSILQDSLYRYDAVGRLHDANLRQVDRHSPEVNPIGPFITLGPLGTALIARKRPRVLLIDEFDKSDIDLPNDLLNVFEEGQFTISELVREHGDDPVELATEEGSAALVRGGRVRCRAFPIIVITSNGERVFAEAFRRRCLHVTINEPDTDKLVEIVRSQLGEERLAQATDILQACRAMRDDGRSPRTDQLLNAVYVATSGLTDDDPVRLRMALDILGQQGSGVE
jgi:MoxR-like ATPase